MNSIEKYVDIRCTGCNCCSAVCSTGALKIEKNNDGFWYPTISADKCIGCGLCLKVCPVYLGDVSDFSEPIAYVGWFLDEEIRKDSSSGGIFTAIATHMILNYGAIVYGAAYNDDFTVEHIRLKTIDELKKVRGSKYVHSYVGPEMYRTLIED